MALPDQAQFNANLLRPADNTVGSPGWGSPAAYGWAYGQFFPTEPNYPSPQWVGWANYTNPGGSQAGELIENEFYYDACRTYYGIADYTGDPQWLPIAERALVQGYLPWIEAAATNYSGTPPLGAGAAHFTFPWGLFLVSQRSADATIRARALKALYAQANNPGGLGYNTPLNFFGGESPSPTNIITAREVGYNLSAKYLALKAGYANVYGGVPWGLTPGDFNPESAACTLPILALAYCDQFIQLLSGGLATSTDPVTAGQWIGNPIASKFQYARTFMVGNVIEGLQAYWEWTGDNSIVPKVQQVLDLLWARSFMPNGVILPPTLPDGSPAPYGGFQYGINGMRYTDRLNPDDPGASFIPPDQWYFNGSYWSPPTSSQMWPTSELNGLILPSYYWMFLATGDTRWRDRCDLLFDGLVRSATPGALDPTQNLTQFHFNFGKNFNQGYSRIWPYVMASVSVAPPTTAFTSVMSGAWTDPATWGVATFFPVSGTTATIAPGHTVTLTADAVVGKSMDFNTETNIQASMTVKGTLNLNGFSLTVQGACSANAGDSGRLAIVGGPGSTLVIDTSVSGVRYYLSPGNNIIQLTGSPSLPCHIRSNSSTTTANLYTGDTSGSFQLTWTTLTDLNDVDGRLTSKQPASSTRGAGHHVLDHCRVVRCGAWTHSEGSLTVTNSTWTGTLGGVSIDYQANTAGDPVLRNNVFDQNVLTTSKGHYTGNMFLGNFLTWIDYFNVDESTNNFIRATGTNCIAPQGVHTETVLLYDGDDVNPHLCPNSANLTVDGWVVASTGLDNSGDGFIGLRGTNVITRSLFCLNAAGIGFVTYANLINNVAGATLAFTHNTCIGFSSFTWGIVSESEAGHAGLLAAVRDNIFYATTPGQGFAVTFQGLQSAADVGLASNLDYNDTYQCGAGTVYDQNGANPKTVRGYDGLRFTGGLVPGVHDQNVDPRFIELRHPVFYDQAILGLHPTVWATGQSYKPTTQVQAATPTYWANRPANFTCVADTTGIADAVTQPMLGSNWRAYWQYTVLAQLAQLNDPTYDSRFSTAALLTWMRSGYIPQQAALQTASDGTWMGAATGLPTDVVRAAESASWLARGGSGLLGSEQGTP